MCCLPSSPVACVNCYAVEGNRSTTSSCVRSCPCRCIGSGRGPARGNLLGQIIVPLPLSIDDPVRRLVSIAADTATRKRGVRPRRGAVVGGRPSGGLP